MKGSYLNFALPMALATLLANAEELNFTKNLPMDSKTMPVNENLIPTYDNRINIGPGLINTPGGISYTRIKPDSTYIGITTFATPYDVIITAVGGYNFLLSAKDRLAPTAGFGCWVHKYGRPFPLVGLEYEHTFNSSFSVGADLACVLVRQYSNFALGIPFIFHFGDQKRWEIRVTPCLRHNQYWPFEKNQITLGGSLGYRF